MKTIKNQDKQIALLALEIGFIGHQNGWNFEKTKLEFLKVYEKSENN